MSKSLLLNAAASGAAGGDPVYVDDVFSTFLYDGTGSSQNIVNGLDLSGEGGMVWLKARDQAEYPAIYDTARGQSKVLYSALNSAEASNSDLSSFNNNGFSLSYTYGQTNTNNKKYVAWSFRKQEKFFDIVTYTGNGTARTISHNLGSVPGMIIVKSTSSTKNWTVYHRGVNGGTNPEQYRLLLNSSNAANSSATIDWNDTAPTSTEFTLGSGARTNENGSTYVAYLFGHNEADYGENSDEAIIKCGSYTTDSSGNATIDLGFEPQFIFGKRSSGTGDWFINDIMRGIATDGNDPYLVPNSYATENSSYDYYDLTSTGFKHEGGFTSSTYIYMAIRRPHKPASEFAATDLFTLQAKSPGEGADTFISTGFNVDTVLYRKRSSNTTASLGDRLRGQSGGGDLLTTSTDAESTNAGAFFLDNSNGVTVDSSGGHFNVAPAATDENYIRYFLRRAKGFYDVVCYTGTGSATTISHNLGVVPELMWLRSRSAADSWVIWDKNADLSTTTPLFSDFTQARRYNKLSINSTAPTASVFSIGSAGYSTNTNGVTYIAYLFASVDGISKIGTYSGTGGNVNVDCGFSAGARFVLIWRTDSSGPGWYIFDSARGIVAGNDPYSLLGSNAAEVTNTDYIDPLNAGFTVTSSAPAALNNSGGTYAFLAIA